MVKLNSAVITNVGQIRSNNEDNYYINGKYKDDTTILAETYDDTQCRTCYTYAVCDGMGGEEYGELASLIAVKSIKKYDTNDFLNHVNEYIQNANKLVCDEIEKNDGVRIGTTLALLYINDNKAYCFNIGDSRVYFYRNKELMQLTKDHTQAQSMVDMGLLKQENMNSHHGKHKLTQHLGIFPDEIVIQAFESETITLRNDDIFIVCSDGVTDMLSDTEIAAIIEKNSNSKEITNAIVTAANNKGGKDNITIIAVQIEEVNQNKQSSFWTKILKK